MIYILNWLFWGSYENETEKEKKQEKIRKNAVKTIERFYIKLMQKRKQLKRDAGRQILASIWEECGFARAYLQGLQP